LKIFRTLLDAVKPPFEKGGKLEKYWPVFDGIDSFLFVPGHTTTKGAHIRDGIDLKRLMITVVIAMVPALLFGIWNTGYQHHLALGIEADLITNSLFGLWKVLPLIVISYAVGLGVEFIFCIIKQHPINEGFLVSGMLIPLIVPVDIPLWMVAVATIFAVVIGKEVFGGTGMNILNVALTARAFLFFAYPTKMSGDKVWINTDGGEVVDGFSGATPLADAITGGMKAIPSFMESFIGVIPGSIGETSTLAILIGGAILLITGVASWRVMLTVFLGGYVMGLLFNVWDANAFMSIPAEQHLVLGGFAFGAVFMAPDPVTATQTATGKYIYGFLIGFLAIMIRVFNPAYPEGMMLAILFMNVMAPLIDHYVIQSNINRRLKRAKVKA
jgi:Na+-transporting NADH:ubiquinone oxidoreductase subunit B